MKKTIWAITAAILIVSIIVSACLTSRTQSINVVHQRSEVSDENQQATSMKTTENGEKPQQGEEARTSHNQDCDLNDTQETQNNPYEGSADTSQDENTYVNVCPPDGRVYWQPELARSVPPLKID